MNNGWACYWKWQRIFQVQLYVMLCDCVQFRIVWKSSHHQNQKLQKKNNSNRNWGKFDIYKIQQVEKSRQAGRLTDRRREKEHDQGKKKRVHIIHTQQQNRKPEHKHIYIWTNLSALPNSKSTNRTGLTWSRRNTIIHTYVHRDANHIIPYVQKAAAGVLLAKHLNGNSTI